MKFKKKTFRETIANRDSIAEPLTIKQLRETCESVKSAGKIINKVSCNSEVYGELIDYPGITLYDGVSIELSSGNLWIKTLWGVDVYVDPEQKEPFKIIKGESNAKKQTSFTCSKSFI